MKIGIIGGTGMIGHHIALQAQLHQHELVIIHRESSNLDRILDLHFESRIADLNDRGALIKSLSDLDGVVNTGAYYPTVPKPIEQELKTARLQMQFFIDAVRESKVQKALYVGGPIAIPPQPSGKIDEARIYEQHPEHGSAYLQVKWLMDKMARDAANNGIPIVIGLPGMCFGEFDHAPTTGQLITSLAKKELPAVINGLQNCIYTGDAGRGLLYALEKGKAGERYLIGGVNTDMKSIVEVICKTAKIAAPEKTLSIKMAKLISKFEETRYAIFRGKLPTLSSTALTVLSQGQHFQMRKAERELGFKAELDLEAMIFRAYQWFNKEGYIE